jgi:hypothetical protein
MLNKDFAIFDSDGKFISGNNTLSIPENWQDIPHISIYDNNTVFKLSPRNENFGSIVIKGVDKDLVALGIVSVLEACLIENF